MAKGHKTGGRQKGTPNKSANGIRELASQYGPEALETIVEIMRNGDNSNVKLSASREIFDRAYGKATQPLGEDPDMPMNSMAEFLAQIGANPRFQKDGQ